jgi:hypothetical protein
VGAAIVVLADKFVLEHFLGLLIGISSDVADTNAMILGDVVQLLH